MEKLIEVWVQMLLDHPTFKKQLDEVLAVKLEELSEAEVDANNIKGLDSVFEEMLGRLLKDVNVSVDLLL